MKRFRLVRYGIGLIALTLSGWSNASPLDISELCGGIELLKHPENRVYRGQFKDGGVTLEHALVVTPITGVGLGDQKGKLRNRGVLCPRETTALEHPHSGLRARGRYREGTYPDNLLATRPEHVQVLR